MLGMVLLVEGILIGMWGKEREEQQVAEQVQQQAREAQKQQAQPLPPSPPPPAAEPRPGMTLVGWGQTFDPDGDCTFLPEGKGLTITVPPTPHDLTAEEGRINAPRVLQDVEGDFRAQVKVSGAFRPTAGSVPGHLPFQSGGLLLWSDAQNYVRLERAGMNRNGVNESSATLELRSGGRPSATAPVPLGEQDTYLRMERSGNQVRGWVSPNGRKWTRLEPLEATFPAKVRVGIAAVNAAREPLSVRFEDFQVGR
jgi:regulation of enolase protein 1 (concanavalin A-like superfamily)